MARRGCHAIVSRNASVSEIVLDPPPRLLTLDVTEHLE